MTSLPDGSSQGGSNVPASAHSMPPDAPSVQQVTTISIASPGTVPARTPTTVGGDCNYDTRCRAIVILL